MDCLELLTQVDRNGEISIYQRISAWPVEKSRDAVKDELSQPWEMIFARYTRKQKCRDPSMESGGVY